VIYPRAGSSSAVLIANRHDDALIGRAQGKRVLIDRVKAGVGHYGVFSGKLWENQIYPILKNVILSSD
jgi:hypothetical protein